jgi:hypothetical protein
MQKREQRYILIILIAAVFMGSMGCISNSTGPDSENKTYSSTESPGLSAHDFLSSKRFTELQIEVDYMQGYKPTEQALAGLKEFLESRLHKTTVTIKEPTEIPAAGRTAYTANQIRELEGTYRDSFTHDSTLTAYMIIVDSRFEQKNVLGIAYYNTSSAFFGGTYDEVSGGFNQPSRERTESISFRHEFGHLLGLVNIAGSGTSMQTNHQDTEHGHHCDNNKCLMYYAMENAGLFDQFLGGNLPELDANCIADLQANGGK